MRDKFTGRHADRNKCIYGLYRHGAHLDLLASACGLTPARVRQIISEGNGGSMRARYVDELWTSTERRTPDFHGV
jgi:hypothetical protein